MNTFAIGVDVGGTKIAAGVVRSDGVLLSNVHDPIEMSQDDPGVTVRQIARLIRKAEEEALLVAKADLTDLPAGIGIPAVLDRYRREVVWAPNIDGLRNIRLAEAVEALICRDQIVLDFDGNTAVAAEAWVGAAAGRRNVVFLIIGTGVGAGLMLDGRIFRGASGMPGGVGWFALDPFAVDSAMARRIPHFETTCTWRGRDTHGLFAAYESGDQHAATELRSAARFIGMGAANIVSILNPEVLVIGGGMGLQYCAHEELYSIILRTVAGLAQPAAAEVVQVVPAALGPLAGIIGAARIALDSFVC